MGREFEIVDLDRKLRGKERKHNTRHRRRTPPPLSDLKTDIYLREQDGDLKVDKEHW